MNKYLRHVDLHQIRILRKKNNPWRKIESENENIDFSKVIEDEKKIKNDERQIKNDEPVPKTRSTPPKTNITKNERQIKKR